MADTPKYVHIYMYIMYIYMLYKVSYVSGMFISVSGRRSEMVVRDSIKHLSAAVTAQCWFNVVPSSSTLAHY